MRVKKYTITIDKDAKSNTVSIDRVSYAPAMTNQSQRAATSVPSELNPTDISTCSCLVTKHTLKKTHASLDKSLDTLVRKTLKANWYLGTAMGQKTIE